MEDEYPKVTVKGAPGYAEFTGRLLLTPPADWLVGKVAVRFEWEGKQEIALVPRECVEEVHTLEDRVLGWLKSDAEFLAWAKRIADGNEFEYGDNDLHEDLYQMLYDNDALAHFGFVSSLVIRGRDEFRDNVTKQEFDGINWELLRTLVLAEQL